MKIHKKLGFCLGLLTLLTVLGLFLPTKASAVGATQNDAAACSNNLQFVSVAEIDCTFTPEGNTASETVKFIDSQPDDSDVLVSTNPAHKLNYAWKADMPFCDRGNTPGAGLFHDGPYYIQGITVLDIGHRSLQVGDAGNPLKVRVVLGYSTPGGSSCSPYGDGADGTADVGLTGTATAGVVNLLQFGGSGSVVSSLDLVKKGKLADKSYPLSKYQASGSGSSNIFVYTSGYTAKAAKCAGDIVIASVNGGSVAAKRYLLNAANDVDKLDSSYGDLKKFLADTTYGTTGCGVDSGATNFGGIGGSGFAILGTPPKSTSIIPCDSATDPTCTPAGGGGGGGTGSDASCAEHSGGWALAWAACPLLTGAGDFTNHLLNGFEGLLSFTIPPNPTGDNGLAQVKQSWTIFRTLASALLVVVLLIVVISQAIGGTFLDAYSVRKMLPRIVIAVIAMQLSWVLLVWIVELVDHLGKGIADLMYQPFHGSSQMNLGALLDHASIDAVQQGVINWVAILGGLVLGVAALPALLVVLLTAGLGLLVGFVTLVLRKLIIIIALIFVPVALIFWVLPGSGTQKLWKIWFDNFTKALLMFPLVVMVVAGGRILAYIAGTQGEGTFLNLLIVFVGFFGPLFILPKVFKWGGSAMQFTGNMVTKATKPIGEKGGAGLKGMGERWQGNRAKKYNTTTTGVKGFLGRGVRRVQSGHMIPLSERSRRLAIASGNKWADERNEEALALVSRTQEKAIDGYDSYDVDGDGNFLVRKKNAAGQYLDAANNVVGRDDAAILQVLGKDKQSRKQATFEHMTGVEASKQALIDIAGNDGKSVTAKRAAQAAVKQLIDTHSEIELQKSRIQGGKNQGRRVNEVGMWREAITSSPPHYSTINGSRPDMAPDLEESAQEAATRRLQRAGIIPAGRELKYETAKASERREIDVEKARIAIERLTPEQAAQVHYGFYDDIAHVGAEAAIHPQTGLQITDAAGNPMNISQLLAQRLFDFNNSPGTVGRSAVGSLYGGKQEHVDRALANAVHPTTGAPLTLDTL